MDRIEALRLFTRLAERASFSAAAKDLKIKQSTASKWVAELESSLGATLVQRTTRSVQLTDAGRRLASRARDVVAAFDEMRSEFEERNPEPSGRIRLSIPVVFGRLFVLPAVADFLMRHKKVHADVSLSDHYVNLVDEGFDLAVRVGVPVDTTSRGRKLADSRRVLVAAPSYLKAHGEPKVPRDLKDHECLAHGEMNAATVWRFARDGGSAVPVPVRGRVMANNSEAVLLMARAGVGIALLADWLVESDLKRGRLVSLLDGFGPPPAPIFALAPPGRFASPTVSALIDHLALALTRHTTR